MRRIFSPVSLPFFLDVIGACELHNERICSRALVIGNGKIGTEREVQLNGMKTGIYPLRRFRRHSNQAAFKKNKKARNVYNELRKKNGKGKYSSKSIIQIHERQMISMTKESRVNERRGNLKGA